MEIERKFLVNNIDNLDLTKYKKKSIIQDYLYFDRLSCIRKRKIESNNEIKYTYTIKTDKTGISVNEIEKAVDILHDNAEQGGVNTQGERLMAEVMTYMVDNGIKVEKNKSIMEPVKLVLEEKLNDVHTDLRNHDDWNDEYQALLSQERKYLYALNRIEQYETEQRISEFEQKINDDENQVVTDTVDASNTTEQAV